MLDDIDNLLDDAISAHEAKDFNAAAIKYTKILEQDSHHADANHNFGLLTIELGFKDEALIFLQTAINTNPNVLQYWVTCINTLINTERFYDAQSVLEKAHLFGYRDEVFEHLRHNLDLKQQQCETLIKLNQSDDVKASFDQTTLEICEDGYGDTSSLSLDEHLEPNGKLPHTEEPPIDQIQSLMELLGQQMFEQVIEQAQKLIKQYSNNLTLWNIMGVAAVRLGQLDHAIISFQNAINIEPNAVDAHNNLGNILIKQGKLEEAIEAFSKALSIKPDFPEAHNNMGDALQQQGKLEEAIGAFNKALSFKPDYAEACNNMGDALQQQGKLEEAIGAFNKALSFKPDYAEAYNNMGTALQKQGKPEEAIEVYNKALSIKPDFPDAHNNIGNALQDQGKLDEATEAYIKALTIRPDYATAHYNLSSIKKYKEDDNQINQVQELFKRKGLSDDIRCHLSFTLAKMYEDIGKLDKAFSHLSEGNALRKKLLNYSIDQDKSLFTKLKRTQPKILKNSLKIGESSIEPTPIFILGMPRSGTTLIEQIISSHSEVSGAGELNYIKQFGIRLATEDAIITTLAMAKFRGKYLSELSKLSNGKQFVTDKMPHNFCFIPLICAAFPEAKIIHVQRNAAATCWSNFKQYFDMRGLGYCYDLEDIVSYYNLYKDLMQLWQVEYGDRIYNLNYENLTTDQENETRKLVKYLELNWEKGCLSPHKNKRSVGTASQQQVRKKVYPGSSEVWFKYKPFLGNAFDSLPS